MRKSPLRVFVSVLTLGLLGITLAKGYEVHQVSSAKALSAENWGLGFGEEGKAPTANQTAGELKPYEAYYIGNEKEKKIYLTFDCGYENGNTAAILDALKAVSLPAVEVHISDVTQREDFRQISYARLACQKTYMGLGFEGYREALKFLCSREN